MGNLPPGAPQDRPTDNRSTDSKNEAGETGCFQFHRSDFAFNSVFPLGNFIHGPCSVTGRPEYGLDKCDGLVAGLTSACGKARDITFASGLC